MDQSEECSVLTLKKCAVEWEADESTILVPWDMSCGREARRGSRGTQGALLIRDTRRRRPGEPGMPSADAQGGTDRLRQGAACERLWEPQVA